MKYLIRSSPLQYLLYALVAVSVGYISVINPIIFAIILGALVVVTIIIMCIKDPTWIPMIVMLGVFIDFILPTSSKLINTSEKVITLMFIGLSVLTIPIIWKRTTKIRGWWGLAGLSVVSLIATGLIAKNQGGTSFVMSHLNGAESISVFFLLSIYTYSFVKTKSDFENFIKQKLPIVLLIGLLLRVVSVSVGSLSSGAINKNTFGFMLDLIIPLAWIAIQHKISKKWIVVLLVSLVLLILDNSRGAVIGIGFSFVYFLMFFKRHSKRTFFVYWLFILAMICAIPFIPSDIIQRLLSSGNMQAYTQMSRIQVWLASIQVIKQHPILGIGFYNFNYYLQSYFPSYIIYLHPHNTYLNVLVSTGAVGFIFFLLTARYIFSRVLIGMKKSNKEIRWYFSGLLLGIIALSVQGLVDSTIFYPELLVLFGVLFGLALREEVLIHEKSSDEDKD